MNKPYDISSADSIIVYAKQLIGKTLSEACVDSINVQAYKGKGKFGQFLEKYYFGYEPNSDAGPDFLEAGLELKASPLKKLSNQKLKAKERIVLNIINYPHVVNESFEESSFWNKNAHLLLVFYLFDKQIPFYDRTIKLVDDWTFPKVDMEIIKNDWQIIINKIKQGKAHELSEGDTFYIGACTKGATAQKSLREQPFSNIKAKQRAFSLKQGYVNHILAKLTQDSSVQYGTLISSEILRRGSLDLEQIVLKKFQPFLNQTIQEICAQLGIYIRTDKGFFASISKNILGFHSDTIIEEFNKSDVELKSVRVGANGKIKESLSFPAFKFMEIFDESWAESKVKEFTEKKYLFVFYKEMNGSYVLEKAKFWNMPFVDREEVRRVWLKTKKVIVRGNVFLDYKRTRDNEITYTKKGNQIRLNNFPKITDSEVCHVRPHGKDSNDTYPLPIADKKLGVKEYTKQSFWFNSSYVKDFIYHN